MDRLGETPCAYEHVPVAGSALARLLDELRATRTAGGALAARFRAVGADAATWFRAGSILESDTNFRDVLTSPALRAALPELAVPDPYPLGRPPRFAASWAGTLTLDGELAAVLAAGGAYGTYGGSAAEAKALALAAVRDLTQDRHEDFRVYASGEAWTPWFRDVAWDCTWFLVDGRNREVTLLATTDAD